MLPNALNEGSGTTFPPVNASYQTTDSPDATVAVAVKV